MPYNPKSLKNLKPAKPGEVRNPHGKPNPLRKMILKELNTKIKDKDGKEYTRLDIIVAAWIKGAMNKPQLLELLLLYAFGKPPQSVDVTSQGKQLHPIFVQVISEEAKRMTERIILGERTEIE